MHSSHRIVATYRLAPLPHLEGERGEPEPRALAIARESTLETPEGVAPPSIEAALLGRVETLAPEEPTGGWEGSGIHESHETPYRAVISHAPEILDGGLPQLLNVIYGNISLLPGVRLVDLHLPDRVLDQYPGPGLGIRGLRDLVQGHGRPLVAAALKPVGLAPEPLAELASAFARAGMDVIKDDHSLVDQGFAPFRERVRAVVDAVRRVNEGRSDGQTAYFANVTGPAEELLQKAEFAARTGAHGILISPGLVGLDAMAMLARRGPGLPIMSHPSGADVGPDRTTGVAPHIHFGLLHRLAGADTVVYVNAGGRFAWSLETCQEVNRRLRATLGSLRPSLPCPAGGVNRTDAPMWFETYGADTLLLIGGSLLKEADVEGAARVLVEQARVSSPGTGTG